MQGVGAVADRGEERVVGGGTGWVVRAGGVVTTGEDEVVHGAQSVTPDGFGLGLLRGDLVLLRAELVGVDGLMMEQDEHDDRQDDVRGETDRADDDADFVTGGSFGEFVRCFS